MEPVKKMASENEESEPRTSYRWVWWVIIIIVAAVLVFWVTNGFAFTSALGNGYQAVFLTNDQVYFGKLAKVDSQYPVLRDVYYLQVTQTLQPRNANAPATNINLVKLGGELHGPEDAMVLNRDHIIFYEDLKVDSQVVKAIEDYKTKQ